jgi:adenosine deaminase
MLFAVCIHIFSYVLAFLWLNFLMEKVEKQLKLIISLFVYFGKKNTSDQSENLTQQHTQHISAPKNKSKIYQNNILCEYKNFWRKCNSHKYSNCYTLVCTLLVSPNIYIGNRIEQIHLVSVEPLLSHKICRKLATCFLHNHIFPGNIYINLFFIPLTEYTT